MRLSTLNREFLTPRGYLRRWTIARTQKKVQAGPFAGMQYVDHAWGSAYAPRLLGTYEQELYPVLRRVAADDCDALIDVGVAEGYFAVGLAMQAKGRVIGYEANASARAFAHKLAKKNQIGDRLEPRRECTPEELEAALSASTRPLLLCDVDGYETTLLDPCRTPSLSKAAMLIELHEYVRPGVTAEFFRRFGASHDLEMIWQTPRTPEDFPCDSRWMRMLPSRYRRHMLDELRPCEQSWVWMNPKAAVEAIAA